MDLQINFKPLLFWYYDSRIDVVRVYNRNDRVTEYYRSKYGESLDRVIQYLQTWELSPPEQPFGINLDLDVFGEKIPLQKPSGMILYIGFQSCQNRIVMTEMENDPELISTISNYISSQFSQFEEISESVETVNI
jgi:hypothetical protein